MANRYWISTALYGVVALFGIIVAVYGARERNWVLFVVCALAAYVAIDNFFCASRARKAGIEKEGHYAAPWKR